MINKLLIFTVFLLPMIFSSAYSSDDKITDPKNSLVNEVDLLFGNHLNEKEGKLGYLLLAISIDHTALNSPKEIKNIGIPFILAKGVPFYVKQLQKHGKNSKLDIIVNNALYLLYAKNRTDKTAEAGLRLLKIAANRNYWPAKYYIAEHNLEKHLSKEFTDKNELTITDKKQKEIAKLTREYYIDCAKRGFLPCQYRLGTWMLAGNESQEKGVKILKEAAIRSIQDKRYNGYFEVEREHTKLIISLIKVQT